MAGTKLTAEEGAKLIAAKVGKCWPVHKTELFELLTLANNRAWREGTWRGMRKRFHVNVVDGKIITPKGYNVLLKVNINTRPTYIRDNYFEYHTGGGGSIDECCGYDWSGAVRAMGERAVLCPPYEEESCPCCPNSNVCCKVKVGVSSKINEQGSPRTIIEGDFPTGETIYSFKSKDEQGNEITCGCNNTEQANQKALRRGVEVEISNKLRIISEINWKDITGIRKDPTLGQVDYWYVYPNGKIKLAASLEPWETKSSYNVYKLPPQCYNYRCVDGLFKISKPQPIVDEAQLLIIEDEESLLDLAMSADYKFNKKDLASSQAFANSGINNLNSDKIESRENRTSAIEIDDFNSQYDDGCHDITDYYT